MPNAPWPGCPNTGWQNGVDLNPMDPGFADFLVAQAQLHVGLKELATGQRAQQQALAAAISPHQRVPAPARQLQVRVAQQDYDLYASTGELLDHKPADARENVMSFEQLVAAQWRAVLSHRPQPRPERAKLSVHALACAMATALSGQTGQPESPGQLLQIHGQG
jgi:hypothetical protein